MQIQVNEGIDAVIVDSVLAIRKGLTSAEEDESSQAATTANGTSTSKDSDPVVGRVENQESSQPSDAREVVETVNGVPVYADGGLGNPSAAIFH